MSAAVAPQPEQAIGLGFFRRVRTVVVREVGVERGAVNVGMSILLAGSAMGRDVRSVAGPLSFVYRWYTIIS